MSTAHWPADSSEHVWGPWMAQNPPPKATQYRQCVHPACNAYETRKAVKA